VCALIVAALSSSAASAAPEILEQVAMEPRAIEGVSARQLTERARLCIVKNVSNDAVALKDTSRVNPMASVATMTGGDASTVQGGDVLQTVDLDAGLIVAQSRTSITNAMLMRYFVQSTLTFEARDGRFRLTHTGIKYAMQDTGYAANGGFTPVLVQTGSPHKKITAALADLSAKVADCVAEAPSADW
jgi:hypothetical protein